MDRVGQIMIKDLVCCSPTSSLEESKSVMERYKCTKIPVINKDRMIIGAVSLNDLKRTARKDIECMTKSVKVVEEDSTVDECLKMMIMNNIDQVPVIDKQGHFCGIVTENELLAN